MAFFLLSQSCSVGRIVSQIEGCVPSALIRPRKVRLCSGIFRVNGIGDLGGVRLVGQLRIDPHPIPRRPGKLDHLRRGVPAKQIFLQLHCVRLMSERADLHAPAPTGNRIRTNRRCISLHLHLRDASAVNTRCLRGSQREVNDPTMNERPSVRNPHHDGLIVREIRNPHYRSQGQRQMSRGHGVLVVDGAIGSLASGVRRPIPTGQADFAGDGFAQIAGNRRRNRSARSRPRIIGGSRVTPTWAVISVRGRVGHSRWRRWLIGLRPLLMAANRSQRERQQDSGGGEALEPHGFGTSCGGGGGGGGGVRRA